MANNMNVCVFTGNLGRDPEQKALPSGEIVVNLALANGWKSKNSEGTNWIRVVAFGKLAEIMAQYLHKGDKILITSEFRERQWKDKTTGETRYGYDFVAQKMEMLSPKPGSTASPSPARNAAPEGGDLNDDIPF